MMCGVCVCGCWLVKRAARGREHFVFGVCARVCGGRRARVFSPIITSSSTQNKRKHQSENCSPTVSPTTTTPTLARPRKTNNKAKWPGERFVFGVCARACTCVCRLHHGVTASCTLKKRNTEAKLNCPDQHRTTAQPPATTNNKNKTTRHNPNPPPPPKTKQTNKQQKPCAWSWASAARRGM